MGFSYRIGTRRKSPDSVCVNCPFYALRCILLFTNPTLHREITRQAQMNIPPHLLDDEQPELSYSKSNFTWLALAGFGFAIVPFIMFLINFVRRVMNPNLLLEHLGREVQGSLNGVDDMLTYILMLFLGLVLFGVLTGLIGVVILVVQYNSAVGFRVIRAGCGTAISCQGILIICAFTVWIAKALALFNGDVIDAELGVRVVYTPSRLAEMSSLVFLNTGMIWGVWTLILPVFAMVFFAEKDLKRRLPSHV